MIPVAVCVNSECREPHLPFGLQDRSETLAVLRIIWIQHCFFKKKLKNYQVGLSSKNVFVAFLKAQAWFQKEKDGTNQGKSSEYTFSSLSRRVIK